MFNKEGTAGGFELDHICTWSNWSWWQYSFHISTSESGDCLCPPGKLILCCSSWCVLQLWFVLHHFKAILSKLLLCHTQGRGCVSQVRPSILLPSLNIAPENRPKPIMKGSLPNHHERCYVSCIFKGTVILALGYLGCGFKHVLFLLPLRGEMLRFDEYVSDGLKTTN